MSESVCDYWDERKDWNYYKKTVEIASKFAADAQYIIEVGAGRSHILEAISWGKEIIAIDLERKPAIKGALNIQADFMKYKSKRFHDLVLCLQVLEHLPEPKLFLDKLLHTGKTVIISVPYEWPKGFCSHHLQDPISKEKLLGWAGKEWLHSEILEDDNMKRLIAVFEGVARDTGLVSLT